MSPTSAIHRFLSGFLLVRHLLRLPSALVAATTTPSNQHLRQAAVGSGDPEEERDVSEYGHSRNLIVNGEEAQPNEFPFFVSMLRNHERDAPGCGGTLISPSKVLTAAHCMIANSWVPELGPPEFVRIGHTTHTNGEVIPVDCVSIHPNYVPKYNDIAIVKLARNVTVTATGEEGDLAVDPYARLNNDTTYPSTSGQSLTTIGFGSPSTLVAVLGTIFMLGKIPKTRRLKKLTTRFLEEETCRTDYKYKCANSNYYACAKPSLSANEGGLCYGDSGGPLLDSNSVVIGVASFRGNGGISCGAADTPDIFTNVAQYMEWIQEEIESDTCQPFDTEASKEGKNFVTPCNDDDD